MKNMAFWSKQLQNLPLKCIPLCGKNETGELKGFIKIHKPPAFYLQQKHGSPAFEIYWMLKQYFVRFSL